MNTIILYGIKNCDSVKKAITFLQHANIDFTFIDFRVDGLDNGTLQHFINTVGLEALINKRSTIYRNLENKEHIDNKVILEHPTLIKRPVLDTRENILIGFKEAEYQQLM
jgi:Spx/MgsR family transcriptional regulator